MTPPSEAPAWMETASEALDEYRTRQGKAPTEAVMSRNAARDLRKATGQASTFLGYPVVIGDIDGIYFR